MKYLLEESEEGHKAFTTMMIENPKLFSILSNDLALKIIKELGKSPACAFDIARKLKVHEQKVYYHMRNLEKSGIIKLIKIEERVGASAKIYQPSSSMVSFKLFDGEPINDIKTKITQLKFLKPFIENGKLNSLIIVGSPDPHGKYKSPASDGYCAINLGAYLGQFITEFNEPLYKLDTQIKEVDLEQNLILIGGPKANMITDKVNKELPIYFDYSSESLDWNIVSTTSKNVYKDKYIGFVARINNPFNKDKEILVLAGKGFTGSRAAVLALTKHMKQVSKGNLVNPEIIAKVVRGIDVDSDMLVDDVEFLE